MSLHLKVLLIFKLYTIGLVIGVLLFIVFYYKVLKPVFKTEFESSKKLFAFVVGFMNFYIDVISPIFIHSETE